MLVIHTVHLRYHEQERSRRNQRAPQPGLPGAAVGGGSSCVVVHSAYVAASLIRVCRQRPRWSCAPTRRRAAAPGRVSREYFKTQTRPDIVYNF